ncbi:MAG: hypothetical protein OCD76_24945 [Reichenbachiella sp.]
MTDNTHEENPAEYSEKPLPMPDGSTRIFRMHEWHWWCLTMAKKYLHSSQKGMVESVIEQDWGEGLDITLMAYLEILYERHLKDKMEEKGVVFENKIKINDDLNKTISDALES